MRVSYAGYWAETIVSGQSQSLNVLDDEPIVGREQLLLWEWMAQYYMCTEGEVMAAALPANFKLSSETILIYNDEAGRRFYASR